MLKGSSKKFNKINRGLSLVLDVPNVDQGQLDHKNILATVLDLPKRVIKIGTVYGIPMNWWYPRNTIEISSAAEFSAKISELPVTLSEFLRNSTGMFSIYVGANFQKYDVEQKNRYVKNSQLCNSKYHLSTGCNH